MALDDVFGWIASRRKRGLLIATSRGTSRTFSVGDGSITSSSSTFEDERLSRILVDQGLLEASALEKAYSVQAETHVRLGKILIMIEAIEPEILSEAIASKIVDGVADVLTWSTGILEFESGPEAAASSELYVGIDIEECLARARVRAVRWRRCRALVPTMQTRFWILDQSAGDGEHAPMLEAVEAGLTALEIARRLRQPKLEAVERLASLVEKGLLAVERRSRDRRTTDSPPKIGELIAAGRGRAKGGDFLGALEIASMAANMYGDDTHASSLVGELSARAAARIAIEMLARPRVPQLKTSAGELEKLGLDEVELQCARSVDGIFDLWSLVERCPAGWVPALIAFKRLAVRDIISV